MKKFSIRMAYACVALMISGLLIAFALPPLLKPYLERKASELLLREVSIGSMSINPFLFKVGVDDLHVKDRYGEFFAAKSVVLDAELSSIFRGGPVLREITVQQPKIQIIRLTESSYNFSDLLQSKTKTEDSDQPLRFALNNIRIEQGDLRFDDRFKGLQHHLSRLELALPFVSNMPQRIDDYILPALSGELDGKAFALKAQTKPFKDSLDTSLHFNIKGLDLASYAKDFPLPDALSIKHGVMDSDLDIVFRQEKERATVLLAGQVQLRQLQLSINQQDALALQSLVVELSDFKPLLGDFHFKKMSLDGLDLLAERNGQGQINWVQITDADSIHVNNTQRKIASAVSQERAKSSTATRFSVDRFALKNGKLTWRDQLTKPAFEQSLIDLSLSGENWSTATNKAFPVILTGKTSQGAVLDLNLQAMTEPLKITGTTQLDALQIGDFASYYSAFINADVKGLLSSKLGFQFQLEPRQYQLKAAEVRLEKVGVKLPKQNKPAIEIDQLALKDIVLDGEKQALDIAQLASHKAFIDLALLPNGDVNLLAMMPAKTVADNKSGLSNSGKAVAWRLKLAELQLDDYAVRIEDRKLAKPTPVLFKNIALNIKNLDTQPGSQSQMKLNAKAGKNTSVSMMGPFVAQPFAAQLQIDARSMDAAYVQPYFGRYLNISLASGFVDAKGKLKLNTTPKLSGSYQGDIGVRQFYALDKATGEDFLKWKNLAISGIKTNFDPLNIDIAEVKLDHFFSRLILSPNGRMNVQDIMVGDAGEASVTRESTVVVKKAEPVASQAASIAEKSAPLPIRIGKVILTQGNIRYSDLLIQPNYTANLTEMAGQINGISSQNDTRAKLDLKGSVDKIAPVQIQGSLNPLAKDVFFDIKGGVKGYELTAASTYAEKYAGYGITKGKLSMDVAYFIENGKLKASNKLFLDQLTLSNEASHSPEATKLPVKFALSLLTDRHGQIKLNLPIEGSLDDPEFKVGAVIWQVIGNVLEKVVTAPFDVLSSAFSGGPSLAYITFEPGASRLNDGAQGSVKGIANMLSDRPALTLEISGWADLAVDAEGIKDRQLRQKMRAIKAEKLGTSTESIESESELVITEAEQADLITEVYKHSKFEKPSNLLGLSKKLPTEEMKELILKNTVVSEQELQTLANRRAQRVSDALKGAGVSAERLFITQSVINPSKAQTEKDQGPESRVQFKLQ